jgi:hypothetical protein
MALSLLSILSNRAFAQQTLINTDASLDVSSGEIVDNVSVLVENNKRPAWKFSFNGGLPTSLSCSIP